MKKILTLVAFVPMLLLSLCIVSCGSDDDGTNPPVCVIDQGSEIDFGLYTFTNANAEYASLEITEDARYILVKNSAASYGIPLRSEGMKATCFASAVKASSTRASESRVIEGKLKKKNGIYELEGFGTATIVVTDKVATVTITENGKKEQVLSATVKTPTGKESELTDRLCHTWEITMITMGSPDGGSLTTTPAQLAEAEGVPAPIKVTMSKVGTYMVTDTDGSSEIAHWRWSNEDKGIMQYSWEYTATETNWNSEESGFVTVSFDGNTAVVREEFKDGSYSVIYGKRVL